MRALLAALALVAACTSTAEPPPPTTPVATRGEEVAATLDLYFQAYRVPVVAGTGSPDPELWRQAVARGGPRYTQLVHDALDVALGFDFVHPPSLDPMFCTRAPEADDRPGLIRAVEPVAATAMLDAVAAAVHEAVVASDPRRVTPRMMLSFWSTQHGSYHPMHTGRCYPHGHVEYTEPFWECVDGSLEGLVHLFLEDVQRRRPTTFSDEELDGGCNCYVPADCDSTGFVCGNYGGCTANDKLDGKCQKKAAALEELGWP